MARTTGSVGAKTEKAILRAAIDLIAAHGFASVTLRDLAREVGLQAGSLYRYFPSKNDLLFKIMTTHLEDLLAAWEKARPETEDAPLLLRSFIEFHVHHHSSRQKEVFVANMELRSLNGAQLTTVTDLRHRYEAVLETILAHGVERGQFKISEVKVTAYAILAMLTGMTTWYREGGRLSRSELAACYQHLLIDGLARD